MKNRNIWSVCFKALLGSSRINYLENGRRVPTYEMAYALARALDIDVELALRSASKARSDFNRGREIESLKHLISKCNVLGLDIRRITLKNVIRLMV